MKKIIVMALALLLLSTMVINTTIAFFTDDEYKVNVMTVGEVNIDQYEKDRHGNDFKQEQTLRPVIDDQNPYDDPAYIDKIVTVKNTGSEPAYVRTLIAVPVYSYDEDVTTNVLHWDHSASENWEWSDASVRIMIGGEPYDVFFAHHKTALEVGVTTDPNLTGVYLDAYVDHDDTLGYVYWDNGGMEDIANLSDTEKVQVHVLSQAVQVSGFDNVWEAFNVGFANGTPTTKGMIAGWFKGTAVDTDTVVVFKANAATANVDVVETDDTTVEEQPAADVPEEDAATEN